MLLVHHANYTPEELGIPALVPGTKFTVEYYFRANLTRGHYFLNCHVFHNPTQSFLSRFSPAGTFSVHEVADLAGGRRPGPTATAQDSPAAAVLGIAAVTPS